MKAIHNDNQLLDSVHTALLLREVAKSKGKISIQLPELTKDAAFRGWIFENSDPHSTFGFWYATIMLLNPTTNESWYSVTFIPNTIGGIDMVKTTTETKTIRKLDIVRKIEQKGLSFGFLSLEKLEVKLHYSEWHSQVSKMSSTEVIRLDRDGNQIQNDQLIPVPDLPKGTPPLPQRGRTSTGNTSGNLLKQITSEELDHHHTLHFSEIQEIENDKGELLDVDLLKDGVELPVGTPALKPGIYIETGGQKGIPALNLLEIYLISLKGERKVLTRKICTSVNYEEFHKQIIRKKSSGIFKKKKIKIIIKGLSETLSQCGDFGFNPTSINKQKINSVQLKN